MKIIVATGNRGKVTEIKELMGGLGEVLSMKELNIISDPEETGKTFTENAFIKANALMEILKDSEKEDFMVIADDSGLCVEALDERPGIFSARYAGEEASDSDRIQKLLGEMSGISKRNAKFVCAAVAVCSDGRRFSEIGEVHGCILEEPAGKGGFGYDPIFYHMGYEKSFGELSETEKNIVSHRGKAFRRLSQNFSKLKSVNIVLVEPEIPQNTGTIARTCAATGAKLHLVRPFGFEITDKNLKRAGLDYWQDVDISYYDSFEEVVEKNPLGKFFYASTKALNNYSEVQYTEDTFIVFGKESKGLPEDLLYENQDKCVRIPMRKNIRSLNLSNAVNIIVYEIYRQGDFEGLCEEGSLTKYNW